MCIRKRRLMVWGMAAVAVALFAGVWGPQDAATPAGAQNDWCEQWQEVIELANQGEVNLEDYADDVVFKEAPLCAPVECIGKEAYRNWFELQLALDLQLTVTSCEVSENTAEVTYDAETISTRAAGVERIVFWSTYELQDEKIVSLSGGADLDDPQTVEYIGYSAARPRPTFGMGPGRDADQSPGIAEIPEYPGFVAVLVRIAPGPARVPQPIHIHEGTCADLGAVAFPLQDMRWGISGTVLDGASLSDLQTGNYAIAVQKSEDEPDVFVACGDIPAAAPEAAPVEPAPAPEGVIAPAAPTTGSGGLLAEEGSGVATWWYALAGGGALLVVVGLAGLGRARS